MTVMDNREAMMRRMIRTRLAAVALVGGVALVGCSSGESAELDQAGEGSGSAQNKDGAAEDQDSAGQNGGSTSAGVREIDTSQVLAEQKYQIPGTDDSATIGVHSLVVEGDVMQLYLTFTPDYASLSDDEVATIFDLVDPMKFRPILIDRENLKEYSLISDSGQDWSAASSSVAAANGETALWWGHTPHPRTTSTPSICVSITWTCPSSPT